MTTSSLLPSTACSSRRSRTVGRTAAQIWHFQEPEIFQPMKDYDLLRFKLGLPHG